MDRNDHTVKLIVGLLLGALLAVGIASDTQALGLRASPLQYKVELKSGEAKKGFVDVSNPTNAVIDITAEVQGFRQTDDEGSLEFYTDARLDRGIRLDLDQFQLGPREAIRMYFILDGTTLPSGDVYGAIFFRSTPSRSVGSVSSQQVKVGTILSIVNGTPSSRSAEIIKLNTSSVQFSSEITGTFTVKNTGDPTKTTGFYPEVVVAVSPGGETKTVNSKLVFAQRSREVDFSIQSPLIGIYQVSAAYDDSSQSRYILVMQPIIATVILLLVATATGTIYWVFGRKRIRFNNK